MMQAMLTEAAHPIANIIHIGAGPGGDLPAYLGAGADAVLLVEARPEAVAELEAQTADRAEVTVVEAAVSADPERRPFQQTNFPDLDSFRAPTGLTELFPGLRVLSREVVVPTDPVQLIGGLELEGTGRNLLVLETSGESLGILQALQAAGLLMRFDAVRLREGRVQLYEGAATAAEIRDYMNGLGFAVTSEDSPEDPERPYIEARLDRVRLTLMQERDALAQALQDSKAEGRDLAERNAALSEEAEALRGQLKKLQGQVEVWSGQLKALTAERDKSAEEAEALRQQLAETQGQIEERDQQLEAMAAARDAAVQEVETLREQAEARAGQVESLTAERDEARVQFEELEKSLQTSRADLLKVDGQIELIKDILLREMTL